MIGSSSTSPVSKNRGRAISRATNRLAQGAPAAPDQRSPARANAAAPSDNLQQYAQRKPKRHHQASTAKDVTSAILHRLGGVGGPEAAKQPDRECVAE